MGGGLNIIHKYILMDNGSKMIINEETQSLLIYCYVVSTWDFVGLIGRFVLMNNELVMIMIEETQPS